MFGPRKELIMFARFISDDRGMETVEWAVVAALIVAGVVTAVSGLGTNVVAKFNTLKNSIT
jgi:Flp pilus assembly pilin Flp